MRYNLLNPLEPLNQYVDYFLIIENKGSNRESDPIEVFPSTQIEMTFTFGSSNASFVKKGDSQETSAYDYGLDGFSTSKAVYTNQDDLGVIMVGFKPWGLHQFLGFNIKEIFNGSLNLKEIWPADLRRIEDQIRTKNTDIERVKIIENFLLSILKERKRDLLIENAVIDIFKSNGSITVVELAKHNCLSEKQLTRRFVDTIGCSPKLFARITRFQYILHLFKKSDTTLTDLTYEGGYYDQAHFIREFKAFTNETPSSYRQALLQSELSKLFTEQSKMSDLYNLAYK